MTTDTAILLLLADLQSQIVALKTENAALREAAAKPPVDPEFETHYPENVMPCGVQP